MKTKTILVTGGAGFIGSALIRLIINTTNFRVINIDKLTYAGNLNSLDSISSSKNYNFENVDICNLSEIKTIFEKYQPDGILHLAAESHVDRSIDGPKDFVNTNILGTFNLLEISRKYLESNNNFIFHHISTDEVFGDLEIDDDKFNEMTPYNPSSPYSASKACSDHLVRAWHRTYGLPMIITNCSNNYGPFQYPEKLIPKMIINAVKEQPLNIFGSGLQIRDWLYVDDHAEALLTVFLNGVIGNTYTIGGNNELSNLEVVNTICRFLDDKVKRKSSNIKSYADLITFVEDRPGHDNRYAIDSTKIKTDLNWKASESFETGIVKTIDWYLSNKNWWKELL